MKSDPSLAKLHGDAILTSREGLSELLHPNILMRELEKIYN